MKKRFIPLLLAASMCLAVLSSCAAMKGFEKDLQVVLESNGEYYGCYTVNIFNNAVIPEPEPPEGKIFSGWTAQEDVSEPISTSKGLIRYNDVKDLAAKDALSITLYTHRRKRSQLTFFQTIRFYLQSAANHGKLSLRQSMKYHSLCFIA